MIAPSGGSPAAIYLKALPSVEVDRAAVVRGARDRRLQVVGLYEETAGNRNSPALQRLVLDGHNGIFNVLVLPRLADLGATTMSALCTAAKLAAVGVEIVSVSEPWLPECGSALGHLARWLADQDAARRSMTARASVNKAKAAGRRVGRPRKAVDVQKARELLTRMPLSHVARALGAGESTVRRALAAAPEPVQPASTIEGALVALTEGGAK